jgi:hypothetical protein
MKLEEAPADKAAVNKSAECGKTADAAKATAIASESVKPAAQKKAVPASN